MKKKYSYLICGVAAALMVAGCDDEKFLEEKPMTIYTMDNAFEKSSQVDASLVTAYNAFYNLYGYEVSFGSGARNFMMGDGADILGTTQGRSASSGSFYNYWALTSTNGNFLAVWNALYQLASYANQALEGIEIMPWQSESAKAYAVSQARFFRGWAYLRLGEMFGGVPIVDKINTELKYDYVRTTRMETYEFAIADLENAVSGLPKYPEMDGRLAKGVANHFLSEAYLAAGIESNTSSWYDKAISAADAVIADHPLMTVRFGSRSASGTQPAGIPDNGVQRFKEDGNVFYDLFQIGNYDRSDGNTESLLVKQQTTYDRYASASGSPMPFGVVIGPAYRDLTWNTELFESREPGVGNGPWASAANIDQTLYPGATQCAYLGGNTWGLIGSNDYLDEYVWHDEFAEDDRNAQVNLWDPICLDKKSRFYGTPVTKDMLSDPIRFSRISSKTAMGDEWGWDKAHYVGFGTSLYVYQYGRDWYVARSAETYLLRAEAKLRKGDSAGAAADINALRSRANATHMVDAGEVTLYTILDERARELSWEEHRWATLLRMGGGGTNEVMHTQLENFSKYSYDDHTFKGKKFPAWTLFAIPNSIRLMNSEADLTQNPGWDK